MFGMGHWEILIIFVVILLIFGAKRIPEMAQGLGKGIREFRTAMRDVQDEIEAPKQPPQPTAPPAQTEPQSKDKDQAQTEPQSKDQAQIEPQSKDKGQATS